MSPRWTADEIEVATRLARAVSAGDPPNQIPQPVLRAGKEWSSAPSRQQPGVRAMARWVTDGEPIAQSAEPPFPWPEPLAIEEQSVVVDLGTTVAPFEVEIRVFSAFGDDGQPATYAPMESCSYERSRSRCRIHRRGDDETWKVAFDLPPEGGPSYLAVTGRWLLHPNSPLHRASDGFYAFNAVWLVAVERPMLTGLRRWWSQRVDALAHPAKAPEVSEPSPDSLLPQAMRTAEETPGTASLDERVDALCSSPAGCAFLLVVEDTGLSPEMAADRIVATHAAAIALAEIDIWQRGYAEVVAAALEHGPRLKGLAREILAQPQAARWFAPLDRNAQWAIGDPERDITPENLVTPTSPPSNWERYAQKPAGVVYTSTVLGDTCSILAAMEHGAGDHYAKPPIGRARLSASRRARVYEVTGPLDWHQLAARYPASDDHCRLVPDWGRFAAEWDAVHLTLGGVLTATQVGVESTAGWSELQGWDAEQTAWARWQFERVKRLPNLSAPPPPPLDLAFPSALFGIGGTPMLFVSAGDADQPPAPELGSR